MGRGIEFVRMPLRTETRLCVRSECTFCGAFTVGSMLDHSIQSWEKVHACNKRESDGAPKWGCRASRSRRQSAGLNRIAKDSLPLRFRRYPFKRGAGTQDRVPCSAARSQWAPWVTRCKPGRRKRAGAPGNLADAPPLPHDHAPLHPSPRSAQNRDQTIQRGGRHHHRRGIEAGQSALAPLEPSQAFAGPGS